MSLKIKKSIGLNTSFFSEEDLSYSTKEIKFNNPNHPFILFKEAMENSWKTKNIDLKEAQYLQDEFNNKENIKIVVDALNNKSLITYIDAPWGSGKTYFLEALLQWISGTRNNGVKFKFGNEESKLDITVIDAWETKTAETFEEMLYDIFSLDSKKFKDYVKEKSLNDLLKINEENDINPIWFTLVLTKNIILEKIIKIGKVMSLTFKTDINSKHRINIKEYIKDIKEIINGKKETQIINKINDFSDEEIVKAIAINYIQDKYKQNNKMIIIDNIERLDSNDRLDIINKIMNWANISGTTFLFLTNFEKIKITKVYEEDFWNKIALQETFKLINDWRMYLKKYQRNINSNEEKFELNDIKNNDIKNFILDMLPIFFNENEDNMDIREIKKLLDNWLDKIDNPSNKEQKELIISFFKEIVNNLEGLDKYFFINKGIARLESTFWKLFQEDERIKFLQDDSQVNEEDISNIPLLNNKMFRIQSNFYNLKIHLDHEKNVVFKNPENLKINDNDLYFFKHFNNFIDDSISYNFQKLIKSFFETRKINDKKNYLYLYLNSLPNDIVEINYFEFKYNNIKKFHIYNEIFKEK